MCIKALRRVFGVSSRDGMRGGGVTTTPAPASTGPSASELAARERAQRLAQLEQARAAALERELAAKQAQTEALAATEAAKREAQLAAQPTEDSEAARKAQERRMRRLMATGAGREINLLAPVDESLLGFKRLLGS